MKVNPYLFFQGNCEEAFQFYEKSFNGKIDFKVPYAETPMAKEVPPNWAGKLCHITLTAGDVVLQGADCPPDKFQKPQGFSISIDVETAAEAERIFKTLSEKATVSMPLQETFWAARFAMLTDRFGTPWMINCGK